MKNRIIKNKKGEGYVDSGVKILIAVIIGAILLSGLYVLFNNVIMPNTTEKIETLFNAGVANVAAESPSYEIRYQTADRVDDNDDIVIMSKMMYSDYDHLTIDGELVPQTPREIYVTDSDPGTAYLVIESKYLEKVPTGNHTIRMYAKDGGYCEAYFEKV